MSEILVGLSEGMPCHSASFGNRKSLCQWLSIWRCKLPYGWRVRLPGTMLFISPTFFVLASWPLALVDLFNFKQGESAAAEYVCWLQNTRLRGKTRKSGISTNNRYGQRRCLEVWHINMKIMLWIEMTLMINHKSISPPCWQMTSSLQYIRSVVVTLDHPWWKH